MVEGGQDEIGERMTDHTETGMRLRKKRLEGPLGRALARERDQQNAMTHEELDEQPYGSVEDLIMDPNDWLENFPCPDPQGFGPSREGQAAFSLAVGGIVNAYARNLCWSITTAYQQCESPIESVMFSALLAAAALRTLRISVVRRGGRVIDIAMDGLESNDITERLVIVPQIQIGDYRCDFLLIYETSWPEPGDGLGEGHKAHPRNVPRVVRRHDKFRMVIECDGHNFHERTKAQAKRDRKRDRILQSLGYVVFRFTGSEIWRNPLQCANQAIEYLEDRAWDLFLNLQKEES